MGKYGAVSNVTTDIGGVTGFIYDPSAATPAMVVKNLVLLNPAVSSEASELNNIKSTLISKGDTAAVDGNFAASSMVLSAIPLWFFTFPRTSEFPAFASITSPSCCPWPTLRFYTRLPTPEAWRL